MLTTACPWSARNLAFDSPNRFERLIIISLMTKLANALNFVGNEDERSTFDKVGLPKISWRLQLLC